MRHMTWVADIANEGLVGTDFLTAHRIIINFVANKVTCDGDPIIARCQEVQERVSVAETVIVPPGTHTIAQREAMRPLAPGSWLANPLKGKRKFSQLVAC